MQIDKSQSVSRQVRRLWIYLPLITLASVTMFLGLINLVAASSAAPSQAPPPADLLAPAAPIPPPAGYPKLSLSTKSVTPTLAAPGGATLLYDIEIRNTGATSATNTTLIDTLPTGVTYNGDGPFQVVTSQTLVWTGTVGFDATTIISFSVTVDPAFSGTLRNTAVISDPLIARPVTTTAETVVTNEPVLTIEKTSSPAKPGANKPLVYELQVTNEGQPATNTPITVTDEIPADTTLRTIGADGAPGPGNTVIWTRRITLELGQTTAFTFSVDVRDVPSGTVIANENYDVAAPFGLTAGEPYTVTIIDPILLLSKHVWPDPPGSNREMTYTLTLLNVGSLATDLIVTDRIPSGVAYVSGGDTANLPIVMWNLPSLDTGEVAEFTFTVYISDVMNIPIINDDYGVCSAERICTQGEVLTSVVQGPIFETFAIVDPIAHKPGGGQGTEVTPTLMIHNVGAGNAIDAQATLFFGRLSVQASDLYADPPIGTPPPFPDGPDCGGKCVSYVWVGSLGHGETVTFTTFEGQNTIGGAEGTHYTATVVITDVLSNMTTPPVTATAIGTVTHLANVVAVKSAVAVIGPGQLLTYTIHARNRGMSTQDPPLLTDTVPLSTTFVRASDGGVTQTISDTVIVSWTLPLLSPGDEVTRRFAVRVDADLISGTQIVNRDYAVYGYGNVVTDAVTSGPPVTTTVQEVGLIDSFKTVTPQLSLPGPGNVLTFEVHLVNSSGLTLTDVTAYDLLPWAASTYQRDAVASAGGLLSDIISIDWQGEIGPFSEVVLTASVLVDADFEGVLTNTVVISQPDLTAPVERHAVAYVTEQPVLFIQKSATPDPVARGKRLTYRLRVTNLGQQATTLVITDVVPNNVTYVPNSATSGGQLQSGVIHWNRSALVPGGKIELSFQVTVEQGIRVVNDLYGVRSAEGVIALGAPVVTSVRGGGRIFLPLVLKQAP